MGQIIVQLLNILVAFPLTRCRKDTWIAYVNLTYLHNEFDLVSCSFIHLFYNQLPEQSRHVKHRHTMYSNERKLLISSDRCLISLRFSIVILLCYWVSYVESKQKQIKNIIKKHKLNDKKRETFMQKMITLPLRNISLLCSFIVWTNIFNFIS